MRTGAELVGVTYIQDGGEGRFGDIGADGGEDCFADQSDMSAVLGQQGQQDFHHHIHPLGLLLLPCTKRNKATFTRLHTVQPKVNFV